MTQDGDSRQTVCLDGLDHLAIELIDDDSSGFTSNHALDDFCEFGFSC